MNEADIQLWNFTEEQSGDISVPQTVSWMRQALSQERRYEWSDLVQGATQFLKFPVSMIDPHDDSIPLQLLAALWARTVYPGRSKDQYLDFGQVVAETALEVGMGSANARQKRAYEALHRVLQNLEGRDVPMLNRISVVCRSIADEIL